MAGHVAAGLRRVGGRGLAIACVPVADGGDGTLDAAVAAGFERVPVARERADRRAGRRGYGRRGELAVVELAVGVRPGPAARRAPRAPAGVELRDRER